MVTIYRVVAFVAFAIFGLSLFGRPADASDSGLQLLFTSQGRTARIGIDGAGLRYFDFSVPHQATWQPGPLFPDGRRLVVLSMERRRDGPGKPFDEYYTQTPTHIWIHDLETSDLQEICTKDRPAAFVTPALLLGDDRMLIQVVRDGVGQIYNVRLDGSDAREFTHAGEGLPYGLSLSPDGQRVAFHLASNQGYQVWTADLNGGQRQLIAGDPEHLYFGTSWSPDGQWILYVDCLHRKDPGHDWADVCIGKSDGSTHRVLTTGQAMWFAATYGNRETRGGGSNLPVWTRDGKILFPRRLPDSKVAWEYQPNRPDEDHFNRDYKPELARGGTVICRLDPSDGTWEVLTNNDPGVWDFRAVESPDGKWVAFCRAATGEPPALWVMRSNVDKPRQLTRGWQGRGADHPKWLAAPAEKSAGAEKTEPEKQLDAISQSSAHGEKLFKAYCAACHQLGGQGVEGRVPPLDNSPWVSGSEDRLVRIVLNGLRGPIEINRKMYNLEMPAFRLLFKDDDIASILAYVRLRYGAPSSPVTTQKVTRVRKETQDRTRYWTVEELLQIP